MPHQPAPHIGRAAPVRRLLVTAPDWVAQADWQRVDGAWRCVRAGIPLAWMVRQSAAGALERLTREGLKWEWR